MPDTRMTRGARIAAGWLLAATLVTGAGNLAATWKQVSNVQHAVTASCKFDADLGAAPIAVNPSTGKASLLGVTIVADSRDAWHGLGCPGLLKRPAPSFVKWARYYKLPGY